MYVCICRAVTDRAIQEAIAQGAATVEALMRRTGAGTDCGSCIEELRQMVREHGAGAGAGVRGAATNEPVAHGEPKEPR